MTGKKTMFMDYRRVDRPNLGSRSHIVDFRTVDLLLLARTYAASTPNARFALLRVWSHSHFWPLMVGAEYEMRLDSSFLDYLGRSWQWKFFPKEFTGGEWNIQHTLDLIFRRFTSQLDGKVKVRRDIILVRGKEKDELEKIMLATVFALQGAPWRSEVDFWRSFVDVDVPFLERLDKRWLE